MSNQIRVAQPPHAATLGKQRVWRVCQNALPHKLKNRRKLRVWRCGQCVSPYRGSVRCGHTPHATHTPLGGAA